MAVSVKPLAWEQAHDDEWCAASPIGDYVIQFWPKINGSGYGLFLATAEEWEEPKFLATLDAAKGAAWADYEPRILAAIEPEGDSHV